MKPIIRNIIIPFFMCMLVLPLSAQDEPQPKKESDTQLSDEKIEEMIERIMEKVAQIQISNEEVKMAVKEAMKEALEEALEEVEELEIELEEEREEIEKEINEALEEAIEKEIEIEMEKSEEQDIEDIIGETLEGLDISFKKKEKPLKNVKTRWLMFDLGFATYQSDGNLPEIDGVNPMDPDILNSVSWNLHIFKQRFNLIHHHLNFVYGAGLSYNYYGFTEAVTLDPDATNVTFHLNSENEGSFKKNHLRAAYLHVPVLLNFESNPRRKSRSFHVNAGLYGNLLLGAKTVQKNNDRKVKVKDKFHLNNFQYGVLANVGYGPVTFYASYGLNELFKTDKDNGYTVTPITFGLQLLPF